MQNHQKTKYSNWIKQKALEQGFQYCGIAKAEFLKDEAPRLEKWLNQGMHGKMAYMENHFDIRLDPGKLVEGAKSVITLLYNYFPKEDLAKDGEYKIAKYAYGVDYHFVVKDKLKHLFEIIREEVGNVNGRVFVDSAPVLERVWARKSGLGWIGKNSLLINKESGSFFFLAVIILDLELEYDGPIKDYCGTCTRCIDACPTEAIPAPFIVDGSKCISYFTIELKENIPSEFKGKFDNWAFGCDICQDVCPWNRFSKPHSEPAFDPNSKIKDFKKKEWEELSQELFNEIFKKSPIKRSKFEGFKRNISFLKNES
jgi:epoxyqueuosine reductase